MGIAVHNFPEGLAVGAGLTEPERFGWKLALLIMLHDVPEGLAMAVPLRLSGMRGGCIVLLAAASGLPTALGAAVGTLVSVSPVFVGGALAFAGGAMLYLTLAELIPESLHMSGRLPVLASVAVGMLVGGCVIAFL